MLVNSGYGSQSWLQQTLSALLYIQQWMEIPEKVQRGLTVACTSTEWDWVHFEFLESSDLLITEHWFHTQSSDNHIKWQTKWQTEWFWPESSNSHHQTGRWLYMEALSLRRTLQMPSHPTPSWGSHPLSVPSDPGRQPAETQMWRCSQSGESLPLERSDDWSALFSCAVCSQTLWKRITGSGWMRMMCKHQR